MGLGACGGPEDTTAGGGIGGTGISFGSMTKGSVIVNGVTFSTNGATITRDDVGISEDELRTGMTVEVQGSFNSATTGMATSITVEEAVRGPVEFKDGTASVGTLIVLGQTVHVDDTTLIDNNVCAPGEACGTGDERFVSIGIGDLLEVHGHRRADGTIVASFIERKTGLIVFSVRGSVTDHDAVAETFKVGALSVNYANAAINDMPAPSASNWNDVSVEVKGTVCAAMPVCGTLNADKVEPDGLDLVDAARAEIEGFVTALVSTSDFTVNSQRLQTTESTIFAGGLKEEVVLGVKLEVEGTLADGVLTATKVKFKDSVKLESNAIVSGSTLTLEGLPNITVTANAFTEFKKTTATATTLTPLDGQNVRVRGRASGFSSVIATEIEERGSRDDNGDVILQGFVNSSDVSAPTRSRSSGLQLIPAASMRSSSKT